MYKVICILGKQASGKDSLARYIAKQYDCKIAVSSTTRPMRSNEVSGIDYFFLDDKDFFKQDLVEYKEYNTLSDGKPAIWYYGLTSNALDTKYGNVVAVVDVHGLEQIIGHVGENNVLAIYVDADYESRMYRAIARDAKFEINEFYRREMTDGEKFDDVTYLVNYTVLNLDLNKAINEVNIIMKKEGLADGRCED